MRARKLANLGLFNSSTWGFDSIHRGFQAMQRIVQCKLAGITGA